MALNNCNRIQQGFDILTEALDAFFTRTMHVSWIKVLQKWDTQEGVSSARYSRTDPECVLRFLTARSTTEHQIDKDPLDNRLSRAHEALAWELRQTLSRWARNESFSAGDTFRALDTMERLVRITGDQQVSEQLAERRDSVRERHDQHPANQQARGASTNLSPWRELVYPRADIADGTFALSDFTADLQAAVHPHQFFNDTYLTRGLKDVLQESLRRLHGDVTAPPVISVCGAPGTGKTHALIALWHLVGALDITQLPPEVIDLLSRDQIPPGTRRAAIVGTALSPSGNMTMQDGTVVHTMWGYLAWQLGGQQGYEFVREDDANGTNPGAKLRSLLEAFGPAVILIDEWAAYVHQLTEETSPVGGSLSTHQAFTQALVDAVSNTPGCLLVVTLPSAEEEGRSQEYDAVFQPITQRALPWTPPDPEESFMVVHRRIFPTVSEKARQRIQDTALMLARFYSENASFFPPDVMELAYLDRITRYYPAHPELFDRLHEGWVALPTFHHLRGLLRLVSTIVHQLWASDDAFPMIMPGSVPVAAPMVAKEFSRHLDPAWASIIAVDVDGQLPRTLDRDHPLQESRHLSTRLARSVFLGSSPHSDRTGVDEHQVTLGTALPGDPVRDVHGALDALANQSSHFFHSTNRYWFSTATNITSLVHERIEASCDSEVQTEIIHRLRRIAKTWARVNRSPVTVVVAPDCGADIPDRADVRLVIIPPSAPEDEHGASHEYIDRTTAMAGPQPRKRKNTLVYLAADGERLTELVDSVRHYLAWAGVSDAANELDLSAAQASLAIRNTGKWNDIVDDHLIDTYEWILAPTYSNDMEIRKERVTSGNDLISRSLENLFSMGALTYEHSAETIARYLREDQREQWMDRGFVDLGSLWDTYTSRLSLPRLTHRGVLEDGIRSAHQHSTDGGHYPFALASGTAGEASPTFLNLLNLRWPSSTDPTLTGPTLPDSLLLVNPEHAVRQLDHERERSAFRHPQPFEDRIRPGYGARVPHRPEDEGKDDPDQQAEDREHGQPEPE